MNDTTPKPQPDETTDNPNPMSRQPAACSAPTGQRSTQTPAPKPEPRANDHEPQAEEQAKEAMTNTKTEQAFLNALRRTSLLAPNSRQQGATHKRIAGLTCKRIRAALVPGLNSVYLPRPVWCTPAIAYRASGS